MFQAHGACFAAGLLTAPGKPPWACGTISGGLAGMVASQAPPRPGLRICILTDAGNCIHIESEEQALAGTCRVLVELLAVLPFCLSPARNPSALRGMRPEHQQSQWYRMGRSRLPLENRNSFSFPNRLIQMKTTAGHWRRHGEIPKREDFTHFFFFV